MDRTALDALTYKIIQLAIEIHKHLGPGLLESLYRECLIWELDAHGLRVVEQRLPVVYKGHTLSTHYRIDLLVEESVIVEIKALEMTLPVHGAQLLTYLRLTEKPVGLLINFNVPLLAKGVRRIVNRF